MLALQFRRSLPRYALLKLLGTRLGRAVAGRLSPLALREVPPPRLPNAQWVRITPRLTGICGSDLATICAKGTPYLAPVTSMPFVLGHEVVGTISEVGNEAGDLRLGERVVLHPALGCKVRAITPPCPACAGGQDAVCRNVARGIIAPGIQTGYCRDTGGGFSSSLVAHRSQVYRVPPELSDTAAVLIEPFACALHAAMRVSPDATDRVLVLGCGAIGLLTIAALRALGCTARVLAVPRHEHQARQAQALGADELLPASGPLPGRYAVWAKALDADVYPAEIGKPLVIGGADAVFDCVGSSQSIDDGIHFTRSHGTFVLVGMPGAPRGVDWTALWFKEITVRAAYAYGTEVHAGGARDTFDIAIECMQRMQSKLEPLVGPAFALRDYRAALACALNTGRSGVVKTVITPD
ncbi:MAG: alcohol dehydrogenase catalytic domain-containing protein [Planctomycetes bacterium]|nr:alcohol dehydrogenase catalytic domain-containing protein [Planctomycetota bacterium]